MIDRILAFVLSLTAGGGIGWFVGGHRGAEIGLVIGATAWYALETVRAVRVLRWLRQPIEDQVPLLGGLWGQAADRARRALRLMDREARASQARLDDFLLAIQRSPNGVILLDAGGHIEWCNETAAMQFGLDPSRDLRQNVLNLVRQPEFSAYYHGRTFGQDVVLSIAAGSPSRPTRLSVRLHPYGEGRMMLLARDVTAVEQAEAMRRDFVANVSHEIRTPLTVLSGFIETLQSLDLPAEDRRRYLGLMGQQAQRMQTLVNDLLTLSRLEGSPLPGSADWTPAATLVAQCEQEARALAAASGKALDLCFDPAPPVQLAGAPHELQSALSNLVSNAVRYTPSGGRIEAQLRLLEGGRLELAVRDTGPGIAPEHVPRLTERFYRVDRSRSRETGGTGLGLAIVKHVVQRHGGELRIDSTPGQGSTFAITLPAVRVRSLPAAASAERPATESQAG